MGAWANIPVVAEELSDDQRLAAIYDPLDPDRSDLDVYADVVEELGARAVLDVGCGTGTFACMLAQRGIDVVGLDPDAASLEVARTKPGAEGVRWVRGDISAVPQGTQVDLVTMTANVAQVFLTDEGWIATLLGAFAALRPGGRIVFETRDPAKQAWREWTKEKTTASADVPGLGFVDAWLQTTTVEGPLVTFGGEYTFHRDGVVLTPPETTLRFRGRDEVAASLRATGFVLEEVRDAPDRPGKELVFVARRADPS